MEAQDDAASEQLRSYMQEHSLEHLPGRKEVLLFSAEDQAEGSIMAMRDIIRPARGRARLGPLDLKAGHGTLEGRMVGLLPPAGTRH